MHIYFHYFLYLSGLGGPTYKNLKNTRDHGTTVDGPGWSWWSFARGVRKVRGLPVNGTADVFSELSPGDV